MDRIHFIELHEQRWFPGFLRDDITDTLQGGLNFLRVYRFTAPLFQSAIEATGTRSIVDLCSGGGGPWLNLARQLKERAGDLQILLTDKYPNAAAFANAQSHSQITIGFYKEPVDALNVPAHLDGFRTMFTSFHHFRRDEARAILQNTVDAGEGIGIFEVTRRNPLTMLLVICWSFTPFFFTPFVRPFRWSRLFFTYICPIIPFVLLFDGFVSCLRTYGPDELRELAGDLGAPTYQWLAGEACSSHLPTPITYLVGYPRKE